MKRILSACPQSPEIADANSSSATPLCGLGVKATDADGFVNVGVNFIIRAAKPRKSNGMCGLDLPGRKSFSTIVPCYDLDSASYFPQENVELRETAGILTLTLAVRAINRSDFSFFPAETSSTYLAYDKQDFASERVPAHALLQPHFSRC